MRRAAVPSWPIVPIAVLSVVLLAGCGGQWTRYTTDEVLPGDEVRSVAVADDGTVWAATLEGVARFDGTEWTTYTRHDGLPGNQVTEATPHGRDASDGMNVPPNSKSKQCWLSQAASCGWR